MTLRDLSIRSKLTGIILIVTLSTLGIGFGIHLAHNLLTFRKDLENRVTVLARLVAEYSITPLTFDDPRGGEDILRKLETEPETLAAYLFDESDSLFAAYRRPGHEPSQVPRLALESPSPAVVGGHLQIQEPVVYNQRYLGTLLLVMSRAQLQARSEAYLFTVLAIVVGVMLLAYVLASRLQHPISGPILHLAGVTKRLSEDGDFSRRVRHEASDEIGALYKGFNQMLEQIHVRSRERDRAEADLRKSENRFRHIVELSPFPMATITADEHISYINPEFHRVFGYDVEEIPTIRAWIARCHLRAGDRHESTTWWEQAIADPVSADQSTRISTVTVKDGSTRQVLLRILSHERSGWIVVAEDITERLRAEQQIHQLNQELERRVRDRTAQLEAANRELEAFAYSVSHDLRAPLRGINGFCQMALDDYGDRLGEDGRQMLDRVMRASVKMSQLIDDLLGLSRVTRHELHPQPLDLKAMASEILDRLQAAEPDRRVEVQLDAEIQGQGDARLLAIVLENLLGNAWKFTARNPAARIAFGCREAPISEEESHVGECVYFVHDNGAGFDMEYADKLFGPFQRLHSSEDFPGTGIGLATVQRIIRRHGGRIWAEGRPGKGASFYFTLDVPAGKQNVA